MANITAPSITLRTTKGSPLTNAEVDANFTNISNALQTGLTSASYTAADVLAKVNSLTAYNQAGGLNADTMTFSGGARSATNANTANTIVARDSSGNFSANAVTLAGSLSGTTATFTGAVSVGSITIAGGSIPVSAGGTGSTTAAGARTNLGLAIGTDVQAYDAELAAIAGLTSAADQGIYFTGSGTAGLYTITSFMRGLAGSAAAINVRTTLGLSIGSDVQGYNANLTAISGVSANGIYVRTAAGTAATRTISGTANRIVVTNGDGVAGNIGFDLGGDVPSLPGNNSFTGDTNTFKALVADTFTQSSDRNLKQNIQTISNALGLVSELRGVSYTRNDKEEIGLIAQEVELVVPQVVGTTDSGLKTVSYTNMVGLLVQAIKEQQKIIDDLTARLVKLEN